ncbi:MAG: transcription-repair coupling factor, partial [Bryobacteraceae bacterium]
MTHPAVRDLFHTLSRDPAFQDLAAKLVRRDAGPFSLGGLTPTAKALYLVLLWQATERPMLVVSDNNQHAEALAELVGTFFDLLISRADTGRPQMVPALDVLPGQSVAPHKEIVEQRAIGLWRMTSASVPLTIVPAPSLLLRTQAPDYYRRLTLTLTVGEEVSLDTLEDHLRSIGYERREPVEMVGEYSIRGGILDVFPAESTRPLRIEFFGDEIESIRRFEVETQRSVMKISEAQVLPLSEPVQMEPEHSLLDLAPGALVVIDEPEQVTLAAERLWKRLDQHPDSAQYFWHWEELRPKLCVMLRELDLDEAAHISSRPSMAFHGSMQVAVAEAKTMVEQGYRVAFFAPSNGELERLADILREYSVPFSLGL